MSDLTLPDFLRARLDEDEAAARAAMGATDGQWVTWNRSWDTSPLRDLVIDGERVCALPTTIDEHICAHDPARVLADAEAKRRIVDRVGRHEDLGYDYPGPILEILALPFADHPDYDERWRV